MKYALILAGGIGSRMGDKNTPKQFYSIGDKPIVIYTTDKFMKNKNIDKIIIVCLNDFIKYTSNLIGYYFKDSEKIEIIAGGENRFESVVKGINYIKRKYKIKDDDIIVTHDAVRPFVSESIISACISGVEEGYDGVMPVLRMKDTLYRSVDGVSITALIDRSEIYAGQAPECFRLGKYLDILYKMSEVELLAVTGSTQIAYMNNFNIRLVEGSEENFKITTPEDLERFRQLQK